MYEYGLISAIYIQTLALFTCLTQKKMVKENVFSSNDKIWFLLSDILVLTQEW